MIFLGFVLLRKECEIVLRQTYIGTSRSIKCVCVDEELKEKVVERDDQSLMLLRTFYVYLPTVVCCLPICQIVQQYII